MPSRARRGLRHEKAGSHYPVRQTSGRSNTADGDEDRAAWIGSMKGTFEILGDIVSPANDEEEWEVLRD